MSDIYRDALAYIATNKANGTPKTKREFLVRFGTYAGGQMLNEMASHVGTADDGTLYLTDAGLQELLR